MNRNNLYKGYRLEPRRPGKNLKDKFIPNGEIIMENNGTINRHTVPIDDRVGYDTAEEANAAFERQAKEFIDKYLDKSSK